VCVAPVGVELGCVGLQWGGCKRLAVVSLLEPGEIPFYLKKIWDTDLHTAVVLGCLNN
jgi:hypothetical protein